MVTLFYHSNRRVTDTICKLPTAAESPSYARHLKGYPESEIKATTWSLLGGMKPGKRAKTDPAPGAQEYCLETECRLKVLFRHMWGEESAIVGMVTIESSKPRDREMTNQEKMVKCWGDG